MSSLVTTLGSVCHFVRGPFGGALKKDSFVADGYAVYEQQHAIYNQFDDIRYFVGSKKFEEMKRFELNSGDLIMSCSGTMGRIAIVPEGIKRGIINQALLKLTPKPELDARFLKYWIESESFQSKLNENTHGAAIKNVASVAVLKDLSVPLLPLFEQRRIAAILDQANSLRVKRMEALAQLDNLTQAIFIEMFGDPVTNPKGWDVKSINELPLHISDGNYASKYPTSSEFVAKGIPFIRANNLKNLSVCGDDLRFISPQKHKELAKGHLLERDVLLVSRGDIGKVGLVPAKFHDANINAQLVLIRSISQQIEPEYLCHLLNDSRMATYVKNFETGVALKQLPIGNLKKVRIPVPPSALQTKFAEIVRSIDKQSALQRESLNELGFLFASLEHSAFRGEL